MKKDSNAIIKMALVIVIAALALSAIVYLMIGAKDKDCWVPNLIKMPAKEKAVEKNSYFDNKGRLVAHEDITYSDEGFTEMCEGSEWRTGETKDVWYHSEKHGFKMKVPYTEFYNDDLIVYPFNSNENLDSEDRFDYWATVSQDADGNYTYPCGPHGPSPGVTVIVEEPKTIDEMKEGINNVDADPDFQEFTIADWDAVSYITDGYIEIFHIVLLGDEENYHFEISFKENKDKLIDIIENDFILEK